MDKWEYCNYPLDSYQRRDENEKMEKNLAELGEEGWEIAAPVNADGNTTKLVLKRKKMSGSSQERESGIER